MSKTPEPGEIWAELWVDQGTEPTFSTQHSGPRSSPGLLREHSDVSETHFYGFGTEMETKELRALKKGNIIYLSVELMSWGVRLGNTTGAGFHQPMMSGGYFVSLIILRMIMNVLKISRDMNRSYFTPPSSFWSRPENSWSIIIENYFF